jgi:hypothetical protein
MLGQRYFPKEFPLKPNRILQSKMGSHLTGLPLTFRGKEKEAMSEKGKVSQVFKLQILFQIILR